MPSGATESYTNATPRVGYADTSFNIARMFNWPMKKSRDLEKVNFEAHEFVKDKPAEAKQEWSFHKSGLEMLPPKLFRGLSSQWELSIRRLFVFQSSSRVERGPWIFISFFFSSKNLFLHYITFHYIHSY